MYPSIEHNKIWYNKDIHLCVTIEYYSVSRTLVTPVFANYSLMVILIEKLIREMNLDTYRVIEFIFSS